MTEQFNPRFHLDSENDHHLGHEPQPYRIHRILILIIAIVAFGLWFAP